MHNVNDTIMYGSEGICQICEVMTRSFGDKMVEYYVLKPLNKNGSTIYVPVDNEELVKKMKRVLSKEEIVNLIESIPATELTWVENDNQRKELYKDILKNGNRKDLMQWIKILYVYQESLKEQGKKFRAIDDKFFKDAEKILYEEFAYVLSIKQEEVLPFIYQLIDEKVKQE